MPCIKSTTIRQPQVEKLFQYFPILYSQFSRPDSDRFLLGSLFLAKISSWYRILSVPSPGVTSTDSFHREPKAFYRAVFFKGFKTVLGTGRRISA